MNLGRKLGKRSNGGILVPNGENRLMKIGMNESILQTYIMGR